MDEQFGIKVDNFVNPNYNPAMNIGTRIRQIRKASGIGIKSLAKAIQINPSYLSRIESGKVSPSESSLRKISNALKCNEQELMLLTNRIPRDWRSAITKSPQESASVIRDSLVGSP